MDSDVLGEIVDTIWQSVFGVGIQRVPAGGEAAGRSFTGYIRFTGSCPGALTASCSEALAQRIATAMFMPDGDVSEADVRDAFGEVVNMLGGNLKALLPDTCQLSLPAVFSDGEPRGSVDSGQVVSAAHFITEGERLVVRLFREPPGAHDASVLGSTP